jgi:hypothetical protein
MMDEQAIQPLCLVEMTLRGLGSYLHGGRLEIRPLTIISGTNGSGKSTWFRMIELLRQSLEAGTLPFAFSDDISVEEGEWYGYTNAFVEHFWNRHELLASAEKDREFGPLGTIGLHMVADVDLDLDGQTVSTASSIQGLPVIDFDPDSLAHAFLWSGRCPQKTRFRLRMSDTACDRPGLVKVPRRIELVIDDDLVIRFEEISRSSRYEKTDADVLSAEIERPWSDFGQFRAVCTRAFWPGRDPRDRVELEVARLGILNNGTPTNVRAPVGCPPFFGPPEMGDPSGNSVTLKSS